MAMPSPATQTDREVLAGIVERVTFHNAETGFCVLRVKARGHRDLATIVGHAATISAGEWITASGGWVNDGKQSAIRSVLPFRHSKRNADNWLESVAATAPRLCRTRETGTPSGTDLAESSALRFSPVGLFSWHVTSKAGAGRRTSFCPRALTTTSMRTIRSAQLRRSSTHWTWPNSALAEPFRQISTSFSPVDG
jgi:hypothetical protein